MTNPSPVPRTIGSIPNLVGCVCEGLLIESYWYGGVPQPGAGPVFLKPSGMPWQRVVIDHPIVFWRQVDGPDPVDTTPTDEFHYEQKNFGVEHGLIGRRIVRALLEQEDDLVRVTVAFSGGVMLTLSCGIEDRTRTDLSTYPPPTV